MADWQPASPEPVPAGPHDGTPGPEDQRNMAMLAHLSGLGGLLFPFGSLIGPLIVWLTTREKGPFLDDQGKEALNFQIGVAIVMVGLGVVAFISSILVIVLIGLIPLVLAFILMAAVYLYMIVYSIIGGIEASKGAWFRYPIRMSFVK